MLSAYYLQPQSGIRALRGLFRRSVQIHRSDIADLQITSRRFIDSAVSARSSQLTELLSPSPRGRHAHFLSPSHCRSFYFDCAQLLRARVSTERSGVARDCIGVREVEGDNAIPLGAGARAQRALPALPALPAYKAMYHAGTVHASGRSAEAHRNPGSGTPRPCGVPHPRRPPGEGWRRRAPGTVLSPGTSVHRVGSTPLSTRQKAARLSPSPALPPSPPSFSRIPSSRLRAAILNPFARRRASFSLSPFFSPSLFLSVSTVRTSPILLREETRGRL